MNLTDLFNIIDFAIALEEDGEPYIIDKED